MAAGLVKCPNIPHTFVHDLESLYWVLFWIDLTHVQSSWTDESRSSFIKGPMSPNVYSHCGGKEKETFLTSNVMLTRKYCNSRKFYPSQSSGRFADPTRRPTALSAINGAYMLPP
jgi:hypothetical protein